jgi:predicted solute-binding protein
VGRGTRRRPRTRARDHRHAVPGHHARGARRQGRRGPRHPRGPLHLHKFGLECLADLGDWWERTTGAPIPLGVIVARAALGQERIARITTALRASVEHAFAHPQDSREYVLSLAEEMDPAVAQSHIDLYCNEFSRDLGADGHQALERLLG